MILYFIIEVNDFEINTVFFKFYDIFNVILVTGSSTEAQEFVTQVGLLINRKEIVVQILCNIEWKYLIDIRNSHNDNT